MKSKSLHKLFRLRNEIWNIGLWWIQYYFMLDVIPTLRHNGNLNHFLSVSTSHSASISFSYIFKIINFSSMCLFLVYQVLYRSETVFFTRNSIQYDLKKHIKTITRNCLDGKKSRKITKSMFCITNCLQKIIT